MSKSKSSNKNHYGFQLMYCRLCERLRSARSLATKHKPFTIAFGINCIRIEEL